MSRQEAGPTDGHQAAPPDGIPPQQRHLFISHSAHEADFAQELAALLDSAGLDAWLASRDVPLGANYAESIVTAIRDCRSMVLLLSPSAITSSHVRREVSLAIDMGVDLLPLSVIAQWNATQSLPIDWRYWLTVVQVRSAPTPHTAAQAVSAHVAGGTAFKVDLGSISEEVEVSHPATHDSPEGTPETMAKVPPADLVRVAQDRPDRVRALLIQVGAHQLTFGLAVERARRLRFTRDQVATSAYRLRDARLLDFTGSLEDDTIIRLT